MYPQMTEFFCFVHVKKLLWFLLAILHFHIKSKYFVQMRKEAARVFEWDFIECIDKF
jgi:hypothetical protein